LLIGRICLWEVMRLSLRFSVTLAAPVRTEAA